MKSTFPRRIVVQEVVSSRYGPGSRPLSWDERSSGVEEVKSTQGEKIMLLSSGGQSTPAPGWELLLTREVSTSEKKGRNQNIDKEGSTASEWTLYGIGPSHSTSYIHGFKGSSATESRTSFSSFVAGL